MMYLFGETDGQESRVSLGWRLFVWRAAHCVCKSVLSMDLRCFAG
jgi:hypothetical protein